MGIAKGITQTAKNLSKLSDSVERVSVATESSIEYVEKLKKEL